MSYNFPADGDPHGVVVTPSGDWLYTPNHGTGLIQGWYIDQATGYLVPTRQGSVSSGGVDPHQIIASADSKYLYWVNFQGGTSGLGAGSIAYDGTVTALAGSPYTTGSNPHSLTLAAGGKFLYVVNAGSGTVVGYVINSATGIPSALPGFPMAAGTEPFWITAHPYLNIVYGVDFHAGANSPYAWLVQPTGGLSPITISGQDGTSKRGLVIHPNGEWAYASVLSAPDYIYVYSVNRGNGNLILVDKIAIGTGVNPFPASIDPSGKFLVVPLQSAGQAKVFAGADTGKLVAVGEFSSASAPEQVAFHPSGAFVYAGCYAGDAVSGWDLVSGSGNLSSLAGYPTVAQTFPPSSPTTLVKTIPSYLYQQYADDDSLQAFVGGYNGMTQTYVDWFATVGLPVYTGLSGALLDWVAQGLYGFKRPAIASPYTSAKGAFNTFLFNSLVFNGYIPSTAGTYYTTNDDIFKRYLTWHLYRGDGRTFSIQWLKRRVLRFLLGANGIDVNVSDTSAISVSISNPYVTITVSTSLQLGSGVFQALQYGIQNGILELPPQYVYTILQANSAPQPVLVSETYSTASNVVVVMKDSSGTPVSPQQGQLMYATVAYRGTNSDPFTGYLPSGWTAVTNEEVNLVGGQYLWQLTAYKVAGASETNSYSFGTSGGVTRLSASAITVSGVDSLAPLDATESAAVGNSTAPAAGPVTTGHANSLLLFSTCFVSIGNTLTPPTGFALSAQENSGTAGTAIAVGVQPVAGSSGTQTGALSISGSWGAALNAARAS